jgi:hypothetical protein
MENALLNIAIRSVFIWILIYIFVSAIPAATVTTFNKIIIATMVVFLSTIIEYLIIAFEAPGFCNTVCGVSNTADFERYLNDATERIRLEEKAGPTVAPTEQARQQQYQMQQQQLGTQLDLAQQQIQSAQAVQTAQPPVPQYQPPVPQYQPPVPQLPVITAPATQQPVLPSAVPSAAPVLPPIPLAPAPQPQLTVIQ